MRSDFAEWNPSWLGRGFMTHGFSFGWWMYVDDESIGGHWWVSYPAGESEEQCKCNNKPCVFSLEGGRLFLTVMPVTYGRYVASVCMTEVSPLRMFSGRLPRIHVAVVSLHKHSNTTATF